LRNRKNNLGVLCYKRISARIKTRAYKTFVRPAMLYATETWPIKKIEVNKLEVAEMKMEMDV
jgi:hypothetical protein